MLAAAEIAGKSKAVVPDAAVADPGVAEWAANHAERPIAPGGPVPTRESVIEAAEKYLFHGLVEHDGNKVPLAENVVRREQGRNTGQGRPGLIQALSHEVMNVITGIRNVRWIVEDEQAVAFYDLDTKGSDRPVLIAERFRVVNGLITEIEALFHAQPATSNDD